MHVMQLVYCENKDFFDDGNINTHTSSVCIVVIRINNLLVFNGITRLYICKIIGTIYNTLFFYEIMIIYITR